jgi:N-acetyl-gamma-glutamyl-phosphate reductase
LPAFLHQNHNVVPEHPMPATVFIDGEVGTTGLQIRERLAGRKDITLLSIPPEQRKDPHARAGYLNKADVAILCLPDDAAKESVSLIASTHTKVIDASTAHRVSPGWTYGFAELDAGQSGAIASATRVANPGCWPQGVIAVLRPLIRAGLLPATLPVSVNGISGYSGGGKSMIAEYEAMDDKAPEFLPYGLGFTHKHLPEMQVFAGLANQPLFVPAVGNFSQGMLTCVPLQLDALQNAPSAQQMHAALADHYAAIPGTFVTVAPLEAVQRTDLLNPQSLNDTNRMRLHVFANEEKGQAVLMAVYDNLGKGASGAAVQNLNLMLGVNPATGL